MRIRSSGLLLDYTQKIQHSDHGYKLPSSCVKPYFFKNN